MATAETEIKETPHADAHDHNHDHDHDHDHDHELVEEEGAKVLFLPSFSLLFFCIWS